MTSMLYARNLPADVTEDDLRRALEHHAKITKVEFMPDTRKDTDRKVAMISLEVPTFDAELIAEKFNGRIVGGEPITLYATLHD